MGALTNLGYRISDQTVGNILKRHSIPRAPERKTTVTWREFIRFHLNVLLATDFFTSEVWSWWALTISSLLCFLHCSRGQVYSVGMTLPHHMRWLWSLLPRALDVNARAQGWMRLVKVSVRVRQILCAEGVLGPPKYLSKSNLIFGADLAQDVFQRLDQRVQTRISRKR